MLCGIFLLHFPIAGGSPRSERVIWKSSAETCEKADKWFVPAGLTGRAKALQQRCEREGRLVSRRTTVFALEELIPAAEEGKGRSGGLLTDRG